MGNRFTDLLTIIIQPTRQTSRSNRSSYLSVIHHTSYRREKAVKSARTEIKSPFLPFCRIFDRVRKLEILSFKLDFLSERTLDQKDCADHLTSQKAISSLILVKSSLHLFLSSLVRGFVLICELY